VVSDSDLVGNDASLNKIEIFGDLLISDYASIVDMTIEVKNGGQLIISNFANLNRVSILVEAGGNLEISDNTTVSLGAGQSILSYGEVIFKGITIAKIGSTRWGSITLSGSGAAGSAITNTTIEGSVNGLRLVNTSDVEINMTTIKDHENVGLYVSGSTDIELTSATIRDNLSDGFLSDFSEVQIDMYTRIESNGRDGLSADGSSFITGGGSSVSSALVSKNNSRHGLHAISTSWMEIGRYNSSGPSFGGGNSIYYNGGKDARATGGSYIEAQLSWWGSSSPTTSQFEETGFSTVDWSNWLSSPVVTKIFEPQSPESGTVGIVEKQVPTLSEVLREIRKVTGKSNETNTIKSYLLHESPDFRYVAANLYLAELMHRGEYDEALDLIADHKENTRNSYDSDYLRRAAFFAYLGLGMPDYASQQLDGISDRQRASYLSTFIGEILQREQSPKIVDSEIMGTALISNYPNPFNPTTVIRYELPEAGMVRLAVYDILGREVALLVNAQISAGAHQVNFDGRNLSSGIYLYRLEVGNQVLSGKMMLMK